MKIKVMSEHCDYALNDVNNVVRWSNTAFQDGIGFISMVPPWLDDVCDCWISGLEPTIFFLISPSPLDFRASPSNFQRNPLICIFSPSNLLLVLFISIFILFQIIS
jgi:hypothetical protein